jgi:hypothetical protein
MNDRMGLAMSRAEVRGDRDHVGTMRCSGSLGT